MTERVHCPSRENECGQNEVCGYRTFEVMCRVNAKLNIGHLLPLNQGLTIMQPSFFIIKFSDIVRVLCRLPF